MVEDEYVLRWRAFYSWQDSLLEETVYTETT